MGRYELMTLNPHPAIKAAFLQIGQATEHKQWFPGGAYRMGMAEIYLGAMADSLNSTRPAEVISELRKNEAWGAAWSQQSAWCVSEHCPPSAHPLTLFSARLLTVCLSILGLWVRTGYRGGIVEGKQLSQLYTWQAGMTSLVRTSSRLSTS